MVHELRGQELCKLWRICCVSGMLPHPLPNVCCRLALHDEYHAHEAAHLTYAQQVIHHCASLGVADDQSNMSMLFLVTEIQALCRKAYLCKGSWEELLNPLHRVQNLESMLLKGLL